ncbi:MAG: hypothetical protein H7315_07800 [Herminiimonas sp.]|nr:hypothetical protein [Herminiimonas sp.]
MNTKFAKKHVLCALAFIAIGSSAGSALAQSTEYRRGYDQGYRDGAEAQSGQQTGQGRINIEEAIYGTGNAACDASQSLQNAAGRRRQLSIRVDNNLCGDPAENRPKRLSVTYRCGDGAAQRVQAREGTTLNINCR